MGAGRQAMENPMKVFFFALHVTPVVLMAIAAVVAIAIIVFILRSGGTDKDKTGRGLGL